MIGGLRYLKRHRLTAAKVYRALSKASRDEALSRLEQAIDRHERKIAEAFRESVRQLQDVGTIEALTERLEAGDTEGAVNILRPEVTANALQPLEAAIGAAVMDGGRVAAENQPPVRGVNGTEVRFTFSAQNPRLSEFAQEVSATRIREVGDDVRQVVRNVIQEETVAGTNPRTTARRVRQSVGLTAKQERTVDNFRRNLQLAAEGNTQAAREARNLELRDKRFAIRQGMSQDQIDKQVERFRQRYVNHRAEVIARTESTRAVNGANQKLMQSYVDRGLIAEEQVRRFWKYTRDERTRAEHRMIPAMNENGVGLNDAFDTPLGLLRYPGDPRGSAENTVQCRCSVFQRVVSSELISEGQS